ncbi:hypothetical protein Csa_013798 [Cucumis sativus]|nr:hypothetical protein Csa_013798 [Cucumis sativus]
MLFLSLSTKRLRHCFSRKSILESGRHSCVRRRLRCHNNGHNLYFLNQKKAKKPSNSSTFKALCPNKEAVDMNHRCLIYHREVKDIYICCHNFSRRCLFGHQCRLLSTTGNYTANSIYSANLQHILSSLPTDERIVEGFLNISYGKGSNRVNAIALCRGDLPQEVCRSCFGDSVLELPTRCPNEKEAVIWYPNCMFRYSNRWIFGVVQDAPSFWIWNIEDAQDLQGFSKAVQGLLTQVAEEAALGDSKLKFAAGNVSIENEDYSSVYGLVQCTPDISQSECFDCLQTLAGVVQTRCPGKIGARMMRPNCILRYEIQSFFDPAVSIPSQSTPPPSPPSPLFPISPPPLSSNTSTNGEEKDSKRLKTVIVIVLPVVVVVLVVLIVSIFIFLRARKPRVGVTCKNPFQKDLRSLVLVNLL